MRSGEQGAQSREQTVLLEMHDGCPAQRTGPMSIRTQNKVPSKRPDGDHRLIFLTRLLELGDLRQLKEQALHSLLAV